METLYRLLLELKSKITEEAEHKIRMKTALIAFQKSLHGFSKEKILYAKADMHTLLPAIQKSRPKKKTNQKSTG